MNEAQRSECRVERLVMRILSATAFDNCDDLFWRVDSEYAPITMFVNCNDLFFWGCADAETVTEENIGVLEQAYKDCPDHGGLLFCCRVRGMRPQGAFYKCFNMEEKPLFDACGPERAAGEEEK
jgi:hypothetical protein